MLLKVISFNIRSVDDPNGHSIPERAPRLAKVVKPYNADLISFQEFTPVWEEFIPSCFGDEYEFFNKYRTDKGWRESPPILWKKEKFECLNRGYFWLSDTPEVMSGGWDTYPHNRICLYAILKDKASGKIFTLFNTHFGFGEQNQIKSVHLVQKYTKTVSNYPTLITGDFNMIPSTVQYGEMVKEFSDANALTINDRRSTYHAYNPQVDLNQHIDYCFIDKNITPITFKIIDEVVENKYPSDHFGIYIELEIK